MKFAEIFATGLAAFGFALHSVVLLLLAVAAFGTLATLFGPIKYGVLPEQLATRELVAGNALVESATFAAIIIGTVAGGYTTPKYVAPEAVGAAMVAVSVACWLASRQMPKSAAADPAIKVRRNPLLSTYQLLRELKAEPRLFDGVLIVSWFWVVGAVTLALLPTLVKNVIGGDESLATFCSLIFAFGIGAGSMLAARASHLRPNLALVPLGSLMMALFSLDVAWGAARHAAVEGLGWSGFLASASGWRFAVDFLGLAIGGGLFVVPSFAAVQAWSDPARRARVIAANNIVNAAFIVMGSLGVAGLEALGAGVSAVFLLLGLTTLAATAWVMVVWRREGVRDVAGFLFKALFRVEVRGLENLPPKGANMIIAPNHVSLHRRAPSACGVAVRRRLRGRHRHRQGLVGEAVHETHSLLHDRPCQPDGDAPPRQPRQGGRAAGDFPGGARHRHRKPDEGL